MAPHSPSLGPWPTPRRSAAGWPVTSRTRSERLRALVRDTIGVGRPGPARRRAGRCRAGGRRAARRGPARLRGGRHRRAPVVLAASRAAGPGAPTVLFYLHYDVQPGGRPGAVVGAAVRRGDHRRRPDRPRGGRRQGPHPHAVCALRGLAECGGGLPVNVVVLVDGEEESGSPSLPAFLAGRAGDLAADLVAISDTSMLGLDRPSLVLATRGRPGWRSRSGRWTTTCTRVSSAAAWPTPRSCWPSCVAALHDEAGRVAVPGFYDRVQPVDEPALAALAASDPPEQELAARMSGPAARRGSAASACTAGSGPGPAWTSSAPGPATPGRA